MRFNMGCGQNKLAGWINVDSSAEAEPDEVVDLEQTPWPWPDNCATNVLFSHSLEHMGADPKVFLAIMQELYRICAPGAEIEIHVPHPRHDNFIGDPTHVRPITPSLMELFNREKNLQWREMKVSNTPLGLYLGVDFVVKRSEALLAEPYRTQAAKGELNNDQLRFASRAYNNVIEQFNITVQARKG